MPSQLVGTNMNLAQYINAAISNAAAGTPVTPAAFLEVFQQQPWVLLPVYNATLSGRVTNGSGAGFPVTSPLVMPAYQDAIDRMQ